MNKRIKKKHCMYGEIHLKSFDRQYGLPIAWFELCKKIRNDLGHPIGKRKCKLLQRYFRRKYYWSEKQIQSFWDYHEYKLKDCENPDVFYGMMVDTIITEREKYIDAKIMDYLDERID